MFRIVISVIFIAAMSSLSACDYFKKTPAPETVAIIADPAEVQPLLHQADALRAQGKTAEAKQVYAEAAALSTSAIRAHLALAEISEAERNYQESQKWLDEAATRQPSNLALRHQMARLALLQGNSARALELSTQALKAAPEDHRLRNVQAVAHDQLGQHAEAQTLYAQMLTEIMPDTQREATSNNYALSLIATGNSREAIELLRPLVQQSSNPAPLRQTLALAYGAAGDEDRAYETGLMDLDVASVAANMEFYRKLKAGEINPSVLFQPAQQSAN